MQIVHRIKKNADPHLRSCVEDGETFFCHACMCSNSLYIKNSYHQELEVIEVVEFKFSQKHALNLTIFEFK